VGVRPVLCGVILACLEFNIVVIRYCVNNDDKIIFYYTLINLKNCNFKSFSFKNLCNLARHKCKTP